MDESNTTAVAPVSHSTSTTTSVQQADWESERDGLYQLLKNKVGFFNYNLCITSAV